MNPIPILGWVVLGLICIAACFVPLGWAISIWVDHNEGDSFPFRKLALATAALIAGVTATIWVLGTLIPISDGSEHCGPGTHYLETGSGKSHSWICVAD